MTYTLEKFDGLQSAQERALNRQQEHELAQGIRRDLLAAMKEDADACNQRFHDQGRVGSHFASGQPVRSPGPLFEARAKQQCDLCLGLHVRHELTQVKGGFHLCPGCRAKK